MKRIWVFAAVIAVGFAGAVAVRHGPALAQAGAPIGSAACNGDPAEIPTMPHSAWCSPLPEAPRVATNSTRVVAFYAGTYPDGNFEQRYDTDASTNPCCMGFFYQFGASDYLRAPQWATRAAIYYASGDDGSYAIAYTGTCHGVENVPNYCLEPVTGTLRIPAGAVPQGGFTSCTGNMSGESHMAVIDPAKRSDYEFTDVCRIVPPANGLPGTIFANEATKVDLATTNGWACGHPQNHTPDCSGGTVTNAGNLIVGGLVDPQEILNGRIDHALAWDETCTTGFKSRPAIGLTSDSTCLRGTADAVNAGQRMFLDACPHYPAVCGIEERVATIEAWPLPEPTKTVLIAMATYGVYTTSNQGPRGSGNYIETIDAHSYANVAHPIKDNWPAVYAKYSSGPHPLTPYPAPNGLANFGYNFHFDDVPPNPNAPAPPPGEPASSQARGLWSWMDVCDPAGC